MLAGGMVGLVHIGQCDDPALCYINRLSDFLFCAARISASQ